MGGKMETKIFVNLPVKNLNKSIEFFTKLGYTFNQQFTDETATRMIVTDDIFVMLLKSSRPLLPKRFATRRSPRKCWYVCLPKAGQRSMKWLAKRSLPEALLTMIRRTMVFCMVTDFRTWMGTFGSSSTWSRAQSNNRMLPVRCFLRRARSGAGASDVER
jgi:hypothetical protein